MLVSSECNAKLTEQFKKFENCSKGEIINFQPDLDPNDFKTLGRIGEKSKFGEVYQSANPSRVIKKLRLNTHKNHKDIRNEIMTQIAISSKLDFAPKIFGIMVDSHVHILMEKCQGTTIKKIILSILDSDKSDKEKFTVIYKICDDVVKYIKKIIDMCISHGDCHVDNVIVDFFDQTKYSIKIIDYGLVYKIHRDDKEDEFLTNVAIFIDSLLSRVSKTSEVIKKVYNTIYDNYFYDDE